MRRRTSLATALAVGAAMAIPTSSGAQAPAQDSVIGTSGGFCCPTYEIQAVSGPSGENPTGSFRWFAFRGGSLDASVTCLFVTGNRAIASVGFGLFFVEDNDGAGSDRYAFGVTIPEPAPSCVREFPSSSALQPVAFGGEFEVVDAPPLPTSKDQCKNGGWRTYGVFNNQGDCVSFVGKNSPAS